MLEFVSATICSLPVLDVVLVMEVVFEGVLTASDSSVVRAVLFAQELLESELDVHEVVVLVVLVVVVLVVLVVVVVLAVEDMLALMSDVFGSLVLSKVVLVVELVLEVLPDAMRSSLLLAVVIVLELVAVAEVVLDVKLVLEVVSAEACSECAAINMQANSNRMKFAAIAIAVRRLGPVAEQNRVRGRSSHALEPRRPRARA
jgi:hypothetical protein